MDRKLNRRNRYIKKGGNRSRHGADTRKEKQTTFQYWQISEIINARTTAGIKRTRIRARFRVITRDTRTENMDDELGFLLIWCAH